LRVCCRVGRETAVDTRNDKGGHMAAEGFVEQSEGDGHRDLKGDDTGAESLTSARAVARRSLDLDFSRARRTRCDIEQPDEPANAGIGVGIGDTFP
jgi:hypothetical protein